MKKLKVLILFISAMMVITSCMSQISENIEGAENVALDTLVTMPSSESGEVVIPENVEEDMTEATRLTKAFYDEYFAQEAENEAAEGRMGNAERLEVVKRKYMTEDLIEELHLRTREHACDAITNSQDDIPLRGKLKFINGKDEDTGVAIYRNDYENGCYVQDTFELHFINKNGSMLADELNVYHEDKNADGELFTYEHVTKYANNGGIDEEKRNIMESIKDKYDKLEAEGYIG